MLLRPDGARSAIRSGHEVPLEYEPTAAIALTLDRAPIWDTELAGFLRGDLTRGKRGHLVTLTPYRPGRIPVVFVHGTASSAARWAQMLNELNADRRLAARCQFWRFAYDTGNPVIYSGMLLGEALRRAIGELDPLGVRSDARTVGDRRS